MNETRFHPLESYREYSVDEMKARAPRVPDISKKPLGGIATFL
jgi:hypothetical protein